MIIVSAKIIEDKGLSVEDVSFAYIYTFSEKMQDTPEDVARAEEIFRKLRS